MRAVDVSRASQEKGRTVLRGKTLSSFVRRLEERRASLYHACQLRDFESYLAIGGIPSRQLLEWRGLGFTEFDTDKQDQKNDVWSKVFLNLEDFGKWFDSGKNAVPNPYGPVLIRVRPDMLRCARDVAVCLRSAGASGFDRKQESLTLAETEDVFRSLRSPTVKDRGDLAKLKKGDGQSPELSCAVAGQLLPRNPRECHLDAALRQLVASEDQRTRNWARAIWEVRKRRRQFRRFARYLVEGTLA